MERNQEASVDISTIRASSSNRHCPLSSVGETPSGGIVRLGVSILSVRTVRSCGRTERFQRGGTQSYRAAVTFRFESAKAIYGSDEISDALWRRVRDPRRTPYCGEPGDGSAHPRAGRRPWTASRDCRRAPESISSRREALAYYHRNPEETRKIEDHRQTVADESETLEKPE